MIQKPPVVFTPYDPVAVISPSERAFVFGKAAYRDDAVSWLWLCYARSVLAAVDPCMEANEGASATLAFASRHRSLSCMEVTRLPGEGYELRNGDARLYLVETEVGDVHLYFFTPAKSGNRREECRIDMTDYGSDASACFIATIFGAYGRIAGYYEMNR